ncbi:Anthranilate synthase component 1 [Poriferisphaera corsica]|uniref:Anthranilate synthase component 1 n=1 Tax=Poriferisphaera corsica TaxID=2528020 RepID=A0A517YTI3_9BACT|nr:anthranilate synthase component I [Poriferisphaera corsica]QDU33528.1 Anthranilate synthase component 1 [Poriferisphaera corsica]
MPYQLPDFESFEKLALQDHPPSDSPLIPVCRRLFSDTLTPVLAYRRLIRNDPRMAPSFLFESVVDGDRVGRYSYVGAHPIMQIIARGHNVEVLDHSGAGHTKSIISEDPLMEMKRLIDNWKLLLPDETQIKLPDFTGGWVGFAGYDTVRYLEPEKLNNPPTDDRNLPDLHMQLYNDLVAFDHVQKVILLITHVQPDDYASIHKAYDAAVSKLDEMTHALVGHSHIEDSETSLLSGGHINLTSPPCKLPPSNMGEGGYQQAVNKVKDYIKAGDAFQIVPSQRFEINTKADPFDIYRALRVVNPSPYMFYLQIDGGMLIGSSPEILCRVQNNQVTNRPLAGTRKRGKTKEEDLALEKDLLSDNKEIAEHVMLVDLGRNDVGRIAQQGSVEILETLQIERYSHVMHISSTVVGDLQQGRDCWDALRMSLPVGTVSGAPKIRAMQIIDELEPTRRGPYAGAAGYADFAGNMDMAIALRTMVAMPNDKAEKGEWSIHLQAGAGIVYDSDPDSEHQETVNKAAALAKAIDVAEAAFIR